MAIRIRSRFHAGGRERTLAELASVVAMLSWKLAVESIRRMREAKFDIDLGRPYFDYVCETMAFHAHFADRVLEVFNAAGVDYADYGCDAKGPDFGFRRAYAARVRESMPEKDKNWVYDQVMEIEAPEGVKAIQKTLAGLFGGDEKPARRAREGISGE